MIWNANTKVSVNCEGHDSQESGIARLCQAAWDWRAIKYLITRSRDSQEAEDFDDLLSGVVPKELSLR